MFAALLQYLLKILRGALIGLANVIPGVSGGTMMVSMGIYDTLIHCITHLFREFVKSVKTLLPYVIGMVLGILGLSFAVTWGLESFPLQTNCLFIGLILGGLPAILAEVKTEKKGAVGAVLFVLFFALVIVLQLLRAEHVNTVAPSFAEVIRLFFLGALASATMVIPGVSGSMILMLLGYYQPVMAALKGLTTSLAAGDMAVFGSHIAILLPFAVGIVVGIFAIAKLIEILLRRRKGYTYCAILGLVAASPVVILMNAFASGAVLTVPAVLMGAVMLLIGFAVAWVLARTEKK